MLDNEIKALAPIKCPHCEKLMMLEFTTSAPKITDVITPEMIDQAKAQAVQQIMDLKGDPDNTNFTIEWIKNPETIFGPNDITEIVESFKNQNKNHESSQEE